MSGETKWTPGPWYIFGKDEEAEDWEVIEIAKGDCPSPEFKSIVWVRGTSPTEECLSSEITDEDQANAHLIAAAPELAEAMHNMIALARPLFRDDAQLLALSLAESALAKARGEQ